MAPPGAPPLKSVTTGIVGKGIGVRSELSLKEVRDVFRALKLIASKEVKRTKKFEMRFGNARVRMMFGKKMTVKAKPRKYFNKYSCLRKAKRKMSEPWKEGGDALAEGGLWEVADPQGGVET